MQSSSLPPAPQPNANARVEENHGIPRIVRYDQFLAEDKTELITYLKEENLYTDQAFTRLGINDLKEAIANEMHSRLADEESPEYLSGEWLYFTESKISSVAPIYWRYRVGATREEKQLVFDADDFTRNQAQSTNVTQVEISDDGELAFYAFDFNGTEQYSLRVFDIETKRVIAQADNVAIDLPSGVQAVFDGNGRGVYFIRQDELNREAFIIYRSFDPATGWTSEDKLVFEESDDRFALSLQTSRDDKWLFIRSSSTTATNEYLVDRFDKNSEPLLVNGFRENVVTESDVFDNRFWFVSNAVLLENDEVLGNGEYNLYCAPFTSNIKSGRKALRYHSDWTRSLSLPARCILEEITLFKPFTAFTLRVDGVSRIAVASRNADGIHGELVFLGNPDPMTAQTLYANHSPFTTTVLLQEAGQHPTRTLKAKVRLNEGVPELVGYQLIHEQLIPGFDESLYGSVVSYAEAPDGINIPVLIWYPKNREILGTCLVVYGAYGSLDVIKYVSNWQSLMDRGIAVATAYVRGGGELGQAWYHAGRLGNKMNTITDTIASAKMLSEEGWAGKNKHNVVLRGGSAGGIPVGAALNQAPECFAGIFGDVPFVDCLSTMLDPDLPLTTMEYEEWGNPTDSRTDYETIASYAPVENIFDASKYPPVFASAGLNDPRVLIQEPVRWVLRLREQGLSQALLRVTMDGGHLLSGDKEKVIAESAENAGFIVWALTKDGD